MNDRTARAQSNVDIYRKRAFNFIIPTRRADVYTCYLIFRRQSSSIMARVLLHLVGCKFKIAVQSTVHVTSDLLAKTTCHCSIYAICTNLNAVLVGTINTDRVHSPEKGNIAVADTTRFAVAHLVYESVFCNNFQSYIANKNGGAQHLWY